MQCNPTTSGYVALALFAIFLGISAWYARHQWKIRPPSTVESRRISGTGALESAKLIKDWCAWLATVCLAAIAANGFLAAPKDPPPDICSRESFAVLAILFFVGTLVSTATLLIALPGIVARLDPSASYPENDFYDQPVFPLDTVPSKVLGPLLRVEFIAAMQYLWFVAGVIFFSGYAAMRFL